MMPYMAIQLAPILNSHASRKESVAPARLKKKSVKIRLDERLFSSGLMRTTR
ncbi:hypothetical protein D3C72_1869470 [compost metagenome]